MKSIWSKDKYLGLMICLLLVIIVSPFLYTYPAVKTVFKVFLTAVLFVSVYITSEKKYSFYLSLLLAIPALLSGWGAHVTGIPILLLIEHGFALFFFGYLIYVILSAIFHTKIVTSNIIYGSICVYLLIGVEWGLFYSSIEIIHPGSFNFTAPEAILHGKYSIKQLQLSYFIYYSFITLTTLGYGDITPAIPPAQAMASLQAIFGQLYLTILVARLVGMHVTHKN